MCMVESHQKAFHVHSLVSDHYFSDLVGQKEANYSG